MNSFQDVFYEFTFVVGENWRRIYIYIFLTLSMF